MRAEGRSEQKFVGIGDEIEECLEVSLVFSFVEPVVEGAFFGIGFIFFFLFDQQFGGQNLAAEVPVVECGLVDTFVEDLKLGNSESRGQ